MCLYNLDQLQYFLLLFDQDPGAASLISVISKTSGPPGFLIIIALVINILQTFHYDNLELLEEFLL